MARCSSTIVVALCSLLLCACSGGSQTGRKEAGMSEREQLKYSNTLKQVEMLSLRVDEAVAGGDQAALSHIQQELQDFDYNYPAEEMDEEAQQKCSILKERIDSLKRSVDRSAMGVADHEGSTPSVYHGTLISQKNMRLSAPQRFAYALSVGDKLALQLKSQGDISVSFYSISTQKKIRQWPKSSVVSDSLSISDEGMYMLELLPTGGEATLNLSLSYSGQGGRYRVQLQEELVACNKGDFLAQEADSVIVRSVFKEPKKVGLRGNLKSMFSGKSRVLVPVTVPPHTDALLYSLRISTNEKTVSSDGKFADHLVSSRVKLFGVNVYERQSLGSSMIERLLFNTRPPREEDAFCNMYVLTDAVQAKKFQDNKDSSGSYKYDVDQSQLGTQSCNGQLFSKGHKTIYIGFENERMRYDNYIWFEVVSLTYTKAYFRPVYMMP